MSAAAAVAAAGRAPWPAVPGLPDLLPGEPVHLVGIGGAGMSGLARVLAELGLKVSGSDRRSSATTEALSAEGIAVHIGHDASALPPGCRLVIFSPAVPDDTPELVAARAAAIPITKRAVLLGALMDAGHGLAVAGTHGKTTTAGLLAWVLTCAGLDPTFFVGGELPDLGTNARAGHGPHVVVEADEYDRTFLHGHPRLAIITNVEHDHPDIYSSLRDVVAAFRLFVGHVPPQGQIIANAASPGALAVVREAAAPVSWYHVAGDPPSPAALPIRWRATDILPGRDDQLFDVWQEETCQGTWRLKLPGRHNVGNALAVIAAASELGVATAVIREALATYRGAGRRFETLGRAGWVTVVDDYAHHPTEIAATVAAGRERFPGGRVLAVVQPHTYSRVAAMADDFADAMKAADWVAITPVYGAREAPRADASASRLATGVPGALLPGSLDEAATSAARAATAGDVVLFLGAGDIPRASVACLQHLCRTALDLLRERAGQERLGGTVHLGTPLAELTSLKVGGPADLMVRVREAGDLAGWWRLAQELDAPVRVLGRGTNVLAGDGGLHAMVLVNRCEKWRVVPEGDGERARVLAESGVSLAALGHSLARAGWAGIEAGVGIPGSVGAAVITNAGAHGWEMADSVLEARILDREGNLRAWQPSELGFQYRGSALKGAADHLVMEVALEVRREAFESIRARIEHFSAARRASQPTDPSVGSMFKNPPGDFAGRLIERAGLKGRRIGGAEISPQHANFFVNRGDATAADVVALVRLARDTVRRQFGVQLELEIEPLGENHVA